MAGEWHYSIKGAKAGPVSSAEIKRLADSGELAPTDLIWKEGLPNWVAASSIKGLFSATTPAPPPLPTSVGVNEQQNPNSEASAKATLDAARTAIDSFSNRPPIGGFHVQRVVVGVASLLGMLATFMPWAHVGAMTMYGTKGDGWLTFFLFAAAAVCASLGPRTQLLNGWHMWGAGGASVLSLLMAFSEISDINRRKASAADAGMLGKVIAETMQTGIGVWLVVLAAIVATAAVFALSLRRKNA